ncbi:MAG: protein NirL [Gammaproteobacteria bacterium]|nr:MAG: protein NirL [Gammaproteobacteria bacterium]
MTLADPADRALLAALQDGLGPDARPYAALAARCGLNEDEVLQRLQRWRGCGLIRRFGLVVHHRALGYTANAMVVWDVPDERVDEVGRRLAAEPAVHLCYRRRRALPRWPFNLYCMVHGRDRATVRATVADIAARLGLEDVPHRLLFSLRRFKQTGARFIHDTP